MTETRAGAEVSASAATASERGVADTETSVARHGGPWTRHPEVLAGAMTFVVAASGLGRRPLWLDEAYTLGATGQLEETIRSTGATMASYYALVAGWTSLAGGSAVALRFPSALLAAATAVLVVHWARRLLAPGEVWVLVVTVGGLPVVSRFGQEARSYALVMALTAASWLCLTRAVTDASSAELSERGGTRRWWVALAAVSVLGETAQGLFVLQTAAQGASLLLLPDRRCLLRAFSLTVAAVVGVGLVLSTVGAAEVADWVPDLSWHQLLDLVQQLLGPGPATFVVGLLAGVGGAALLRRPVSDPLERWRTIAPVLWAIGPALLLLTMSFARPYFIGRYVAASAPALAVLVAVGVTSIDRRCRRARRRSTATGTVGPGAVALLVTLVAGQVALADDPGHAWDRAAEKVSAEARPGDALIFPMPLLRSPFEAAWRDVDDRPAIAPALLSNGRELGEVRRVQPFWDLGRVLAELEGSRRLWVVHATDPGWGDSALDNFLAIPEIRRDLVVADHDHYPGGVQVYLLERR